MIVGWQLATHLRTELVLDALEMANGLRRPEDGLIAHTDRGCQAEFNRSSQHRRFTEQMVALWSAVLDLEMDGGFVASTIAEAA
jgi:hypothetical protein